MCILLIIYSYLFLKNIINCQINDEKLEIKFNFEFISKKKFFFE